MVVFEDFVYPLCVERHIDEDARLVGPSTASAMDTHSQDNPGVTILTYKRAAIISLQKKKSIARFSTSLVEKWL